MTSAWAELVALAERERDLVREERWEEIPALSEHRLRASQALGAPTADARPYLERLLELQGEIHAGLSAGRALTLRKLGELNRSAAALRGYNGGSRRPAATSVDGRA